MSIEIKISSIFQPYTGHRAAVEVSGGTVAECLEDLVGKFPKLERVLYDGNGKFNRHISVFLNDESAFPGEPDRPVKEGDMLRLVMLFAGG